MNETGFWLIILAGAAYGALHSLLAANGTKRLVARVLGQAVLQRYYRLFYTVQAGVTLLPVLWLAVRLPDRTIYTIPTPWVWLTLALQAIAAAGLMGGVLQTGAFRFLGLSQLFDATPQQPADAGKPERLVTSGLYRWVRHPLYTCSFVLLWLLPVLSWNSLALNLSLSAYLVTGALLEERKLVEQFGAQYEEYRRRTPMLIPGLKL
jgi:protein-S-isoprenylcysteine O-methyltransferase Ste14